MEKFYIHASTNFSKTTKCNLQKLTRILFQSNISTVHAMQYVVTSCYDSINETCYAASSFVSLKKVFNKVSHDALFTKLNNYDIRGVAYNLIFLYLHNRQQFVSNNHSKSDLKLIHCGGPELRRLVHSFLLLKANLDMLLTTLALLKCERLKS